MRLDNLIKEFVDNYADIHSEPFGHNETTKILTELIPAELYDLTALSPDEFKIYGSVGTGNWAEIPWVAVLDRKITDSTRTGYYVVFLFDKELENVYLCLGVGWTQFEEEYGVKQGKARIKSVCAHYSKLLVQDVQRFNSGPIDLRAQNNLGKG